MIKLGLYYSMCVPRLRDLRRIFLYMTRRHLLFDLKSSLADRLVSKDLTLSGRLQPCILIHIYVSRAYSLGYCAGPHDNGVLQVPEHIPPSH
jgi:hypothetical protein